MASKSIKKRTRVKRVRDKRTGEIRETEVEYWRARYRDDAGKEHARHFERRVDGQKWLDGQTAALVTGTHVPPKAAKMTVGSGATRGSRATPPGARQPSARLACTSGRSGPSSAPCACRRSAPPT